MSFSNVPVDMRYAVLIAEPRPDVSAPTAAKPASHQNRYSPLIEEAAMAYQMDTALLHAVIATESGYNPKAVSKKGAAGLMQLMPDTAKRYGVADSLDPKQNINGGARYLKDLLQLFGQDLQLALAAYNAGENAVLRHGKRVPPYPETIAYIPKVMNLYKKYQPKM